MVQAQGLTQARSRLQRGRFDAVNVASWHNRDAPSHFLNVGKSPGSGHAALAAVIPAKAGTSGWCREVPAFAGMTEGSRG